MSDYKLKTPVAFLVFNRPETTERVFEEIRKAKPPKLLVVADGPRINNKTDIERCARVKEIIDTVDWECEVIKNYSEVNLGCKKRISSGISWIFDNVDEAIILEDDCLPEQSFFRYCGEMLEYYRNDERVMIISGNNFQGKKKVSPHSYYFSTYSYIWGWASWKRAWEKYDVDMKLLPEVLKQNYLDYWFSDKKTADHWKEEFLRAYENRIDTWDYQFLFSCVINQGVCAVPEVNLVTNIGFGEGASHTGDKSSKSSNIPTHEISFPLVHPGFVMRNLKADMFDEKNYILPGLFKREVRKLKRKLR